MLVSSAVGKAVAVAILMTPPSAKAPERGDRPADPEAARNVARKDAGAYPARLRAYAACSAPRK